MSEFVGRQTAVEGFVPQFRATWSKAIEPVTENRRAQSVSRNKKQGEGNLEIDLERAAAELQRLAEDYVELERICGMPMAKAYLSPYSLSGATPEQPERRLRRRNEIGLGLVMGR